MKKAKLLVVLICPLVFQNCFIEEIIPINAKCKSNCVEVTGRFTTEDSFLPIEDVQLELSWIQNCGMTACWFGDASRVIATTKTDANGNYNFRFSIKDHELTGGFFTVAFVPSSDDYVTENRGFTISQPLKRNSTVTHNYHLPTRGEMQLRLSNVELISGDDRIVCQVIYEFGNNAELNWSEPFDSGELASTTFCEVAGNQENYIRVFKRKAGIETTEMDTVYVQQGQIYQYEIEF